MGWGDPFKNAWNGATGKAKQLGSSIANGYDSSKKWTAEKATQAKDWAVKKGTEAKDYTVQKATQAKDYTVKKATEAKDYAVKQGTNAARAGEKAVLRGLENTAGVLNRGLNSAKNAKDSLAKKANDARNKVRSWFGKEPVGDACPTCSGKGEPKTDKEMDGMYMGAGCKPKKTLAEAKASPTVPADDNACCKGKPRKRIYYVNGISTPHQAHCTTLREIANSTCAEVIGIYNATDGFIGDALQTGGDRQLINRAAAGEPVQLDGRNKAVNTVSNTVYSEIQNKENKEPPEFWAHSQGGAVTSLGLYSADNRLQAAGNPKRLSGMKVNSYGSAAPRWVDGPNYDHSVNVNDITPVSLGLGDSGNASKAGKNAKIHRFSGSPGKWVDEGKPGYKKGFLTPTSNHGIEETYIAKRDADIAALKDPNKPACGKVYKDYKEAQKKKQQPQPQR